MRRAPQSRHTKFVVSLRGEACLCAVLPRSGKRRIFGCMPIADRLGHRDYDAALALIADAADTCGTQPFELPAIERLLRVIPAERAGYFEYKAGGVCLGPPNSFFVEQPSLPKQPLDWASDGVREAVASWPLQDIPHVPGPPVPLATQTHDFLTGRRLQRNLFYGSIMRPGGLEHELKVWLPAPKRPIAVSSSSAVAVSRTSMSETERCSRSSGPPWRGSARAGSAATGLRS